MTTISTKVAKHHLGRCHNISDELYTSVRLAKMFLTKNTCVTSTVKSTSRGLPHDLLNTTKNPNRDHAKNMNRVPRGTFYSRQNGQIVVSAWKYSLVMLMLSTAHPGWRDPDVHKLTRKIPDDDSGRRVSQVIPAPPQACDQLYKVYGRRGQGWSTLCIIHNMYLLQESSSGGHCWSQLIHCIMYL